MMEINYGLVGLVGIGMIVLIAWLIWRNGKDQKSVENTLNQSELKPEKHVDPNGSV